MLKLKTLAACSALALAAALTASCTSETRTIRHETVQTVPAPPAVVERRTTVETVPHRRS